MLGIEGSFGAQSFAQELTPLSWREGSLPFFFFKWQTEEFFWGWANPGWGRLRNHQRQDTSVDSPLSPAFPARQRLPLPGGQKGCLTLRKMKFLFSRVV